MTASNTLTRKLRPSTRLWMAAAVLGVSATLAAPAFAHGGMQGYGGHGMGMGMGMMGGMGMGGRMAHPEKAERMVERMLKGIDVSEAQRKQILEIARATGTDMQSQREAGRQLHQQGMQLFAQPQIDANAVEALRQQRMAHMDQQSRRMSQRMAQHGERHERRHDRHGGHRGEHHGDGPRHQHPQQPAQPR